MSISAAAAITERDTHMQDDAKGDGPMTEGRPTEREAGEEQGTNIGIV